MTERLFKLKPYPRRMMWAGPHLDPLLRFERGDGYGVGEALDASGLDAMSSTFEGGRFDGRRLADVYVENPALFVGDLAEEWPQFPILVKRLDAGDKLSVQVHPDDAKAEALESAPNGKSEAWIILDADEDASVYLGFRDDVSEEAARAGVDRGSVVPLLRELKVRAGDIIPVPAGCIHAIGEGVLLFEVQQPADITYRLHDYDRDEPGHGRRELHLEKGLDSLDFDLRPEKGRPQLVDEQAGGRRFELCALDPFRIESLEIDGRYELSGDDLVVIQVLQGRVELSSSDRRDSLSLESGETALATRRPGFGVELKGRGTLLLATPRPVSKS